MTTTIEEIIPVHIVEQVEQRLIATFETALVAALEAGSLIALRWQIHEEEYGTNIEYRSKLILEAKKIEARWTEIETVHGEGSLLVEESRVIQYSLITRGSRFSSEPHLLRNARRLRKLKGPEWWLREHRLHSLLEAVRSCKH